MKNRGDIDSQVDSVKQSVKDICAEMNLMKHFDPIVPEHLLELYLNKPSQIWVKELESKILAKRRVASSEALVYIQELLDTTANQVSFLRTLRLERPGLRAALQETLEENTNTKTLNDHIFKEECSSVLSALIEAPLSDEHLVREFIVYDTLRQIVEFYRTPKHLRSAGYSDLKKSLESQISKWKAEDILKQDILAYKVLHKFLLFTPEETDHKLGKRSKSSIHMATDYVRRNCEESYEELPVMKSKGGKISLHPRDHTRQLPSKQTTGGFEVSFNNGSFLTAQTDEDCQNIGVRKVVREAIVSKRPVDKLHLFDQSFTDPKRLAKAVLASGVRTVEESASCPLTILGGQTCSNSFLGPNRLRDFDARSHKSGMSSQHLSQATGGKLRHREVNLEEQSGTKLATSGIPEHQHQVAPMLPLTTHQSKATSKERQRDNGREMMIQEPETPQEVASRQLFNMDFSQMKEKLNSEPTLYEQQRCLQRLMLESFDKCRDEARKQLFAVLQHEYHESTARFHAKKLEAEIFGLFYSDISLYREKVDACEANLSKMLKKDWPTDQLMTTCFDYDLITSIRNHVQNMIKGTNNSSEAAQQAYQSPSQLESEVVEKGYESNRRPIDSANSPIGRLFEGAPAHSPTEMLQEHHGMEEEQPAVPDDNQEGSCIEIRPQGLDQGMGVTPWKLKNSAIFEHLRNTAETDRRPENLPNCGANNNTVFQNLRGVSPASIENPFDDDDLDLSTDSFEFLEYIAKIKEAEIELLNQHLDSVTRENELLKEALLHIKTNLMVLQTVESENEAKAYPSGSLEDTSQQHELQNLAFPLDDHSAGLKILPKGKP